MASLVRLEFSVIPAKGYEYVRGVGNPDETVECEWDTGAFGGYDFQGWRPTANAPGPMFGRDWAWPDGGEGPSACDWPTRSYSASGSAIILLLET
jgi:hypothetical protein